MRTFAEYVEAEHCLDEGLLSFLGRGGPTLRDGSPIPKSWSPDTVKTYNAYYDRALRVTKDPAKAHFLAVKEAIASQQSAGKMAGYQSAVSAPTKSMPAPQRAPFGQGTMPPKDLTGHLTGN